MKLSVLCVALLLAGCADQKQEMFDMVVLVQELCEVPVGISLSANAFTRVQTFEVTCARLKEEALSAAKYHATKK